jgi:RNA polymerase sigma factor (sigma-70 family)
LIGIARRVIVEEMKPSPEFLEPDPPEPDLIEPMDSWTQGIDLRAAVRALEPRDRELIALRYGADLTARQIGKLLDARTNTVEVALHRALSRLRGLLSPEGEEGGTPEDVAPRHRRSC